MKLLKLTLLLLAWVSLSTAARDFTYQNVVYTVLSEEDKTCQTKAAANSYATSVNNCTGNLILPANPIDEETQYTLVAIGNYSFNANKITSVTIPSTVTTIGDGAFEATSLTSVTIPNSVVNLGSYAFYSASSLTTVNLPSTLTEIPNGCFCYCSKLKSIKLPSQLQSIGNAAFRSSGLTSLTIPDEVTSIGSNAFQECNDLQQVTMGASVKTIGEGAFVNCPVLLKAYYPSIEALCNITFMDQYANPTADSYKDRVLYIAGKTPENIVIPESITSINNYAFMTCYTLKSVAIPNSVKTIGDYAFESCVSMEEIDLGDAITSIGSSAFSGCRSLKSISIPSSVEEIKSSAFYECNGLNYAEFTSFDDLNKITFFDIRSNPLYCAHNLYFNGEEISDLPEGITSINDYAFCGWGTNSITIPSSVTSLGNYSFAYNANLTEITIPSSVKTIGDYAFNGSSLQSVDIGCGIESIGQNALNIKSLLNINITAPVPPTIDMGMFSTNTCDGTLRVQDDDDSTVIAAYRSAANWKSINNIEPMVVMEQLTGNNDKPLQYNPGSTFQCEYSIYPANSTLKQLYWHSTNPSVATVNSSGLVTFIDNSDQEPEINTESDEDLDVDLKECKIIASTLYNNGPTLEFIINSDTSGIDKVTVDASDKLDSDTAIYSLNGRQLNIPVQNLPTGFYIVREGNKTRKVVIK